MCDPVSLTLGAVSIGSAVASHVARSKEAKAERQAAQQAFLGTISDLTERLQEEREVTALNIGEIGRQERVSAATAVAGAGEAGVAGISLDLLLGDIERQRGEAVTGLRLQQQFTEAQLQREAEAALAGRDSRINQAQGPSLLSLGLDIVGRGLATSRTIAARPQA